MCNLLPCSLVFFLLFSNNWSKTGQLSSLPAHLPAEPKGCSCSLTSCQLLDIKSLCIFSTRLPRQGEPLHPPHTHTHTYSPLHTHTGWPPCSVLQTATELYVSFKSLSLLFLLLLLIVSFSFSFFGCNLPSLHKCYLFKHSQYSKLPDCDYSLIFWSNACIIHCPPAHPQKTHYVHRWFIMFILNEWISFYFWHCQAIYLEDNFFLFSSSSSHFFYHLLLKILVFNSVG